MSGTRAAARPVMALLVLALVVGLGVLAFVRRDPPPAPPPTRAAQPSVVEASAGSAAWSSTGPVDEPPPREELVAGVRCTLFDAAGAPLGGHRVQLEPTSERSAESGVLWERQRTTSSDGTCSWRHPGAGSYRVELCDRPAVQVAFELPAERGAAVELRLPEGLVACQGRFVRGARTAADVVARFRLPDGSEVVGSAGHHSEDGSVSLARGDRIGTVLPAGVHRLRGLAPPFGERQPVAGSYPASMSAALRSALDSGWQLVVDRDLAVPSGVARFEWEAEVECADVVFAVATEHGPLSRAVKLRVEGTTLLAGQPVVHEVQTGAGDRATLPWLQPGSYRVRAKGPLVLACDDVPFDVRAGDGARTVPVTVREGAHVRLELRGLDGRRTTLAPDLLPALRASGAECACVRLEGQQVGYVGVPPGEVELRFDEPAIDGERTFLPFDPLPPSTATVRPGTDNVLELRVEMRAHVDLRACDRSGREQFDAKITVHAGDRRVRSGPVEHGNRWAGYLPPGDYRVVVDRGGRTREHGLAVDRRAIRLRLRP